MMFPRCGTLFTYGNAEVMSFRFTALSSRLVRCQVRHETGGGACLGRCRRPPSIAPRQENVSRCHSLASFFLPFVLPVDVLGAIPAVGGLACVALPEHATRTDATLSSVGKELREDVVTFRRNRALVLMSIPVLDGFDAAGLS